MKIFVIMKWLLFIFVIAIVNVSCKSNSKSSAKLDDEKMPINGKVDSTRIEADMLLWKEFARLSYIENDYERAIYYCNQALEVLRLHNQKNSELYAELLAKKCKFQREAGDTDESIVSGEYARLLYDSLHITNQAYAELLKDLACAHANNFDYERSLSLLKMSCAFYGGKSDSLSMAENYNLIGAVYLRNEDLINSEKYILKNITFFQNHDNTFLIEKEHERNNWASDDNSTAAIKHRIIIINISSLSTLADIYQKQERFIDAIAMEKKSGELIQEISDSPYYDYLYANHLRILSKYYQQNDNYNEAIITGKKSIQRFSTFNMEAATISQLQLAIVYSEMGDVSNAVTTQSPCTAV